MALLNHSYYFIDNRFYMHRSHPIACIVTLASLAGCGEMLPQPDVSPSAETAWAGDTESDTSAVPFIPIVVDGWGEIQEHSCTPLDRECYAKTACEATAGELCIFNDLGCSMGSEKYTGGYHPESMAPEIISFSSRIPGFISQGYLGNICSCDLTLLESLGLGVMNPALNCAHSYWFASVPPP